MTTILQLAAYWTSIFFQLVSLWWCNTQKNQTGAFHVLLFLEKMLRTQKTGWGVPGQGLDISWQRSWFASAWWKNELKHLFIFKQASERQVGPFPFSRCSQGELRSVGSRRKERTTTSVSFSYIPLLIKLWLIPFLCNLVLATQSHGA